MQILENLKSVSEFRDLLDPDRDLTPVRWWCKLPNSKCSGVFNTRCMLEELHLWVYPNSFIIRMGEDDRPEITMGGGKWYGFDTIEQCFAHSVGNSDPMVDRPMEEFVAYLPEEEWF